MKYSKILILCIMMIYVLSFNCTDNHDCNNMGECYINECICNYCWINYKVTTKQCNYKQKNQLIVFILSFILGIFGMDHIYIGNYILAIPKLLLFIIFISIYKFIPINNDVFNNKRKMVIMCVIFGLITFIWYMNDVILFGLNTYTDENNIQLCRW